jgi:hypothetical protein
MRGLAIALVCVLVACQGPQAEPLPTGPDSVAFRVNRLPSRGDLERYHAEYGRVAEVQFDIEFTANRPGDRPDLDMTFGQGAIVAVPDFRSSVLVANLCRALQAEPCPAQPRVRSSKVEFELVVLGRGLSRGKTKSGETFAGAFSRSPPGKWITTKLFFGENTDEDAGEVYLNLNPEERWGEFLMKDSEYGVAVMRQLVRVL